MESVLERINKNKFYKIPGGIHPPEQKFLTNDKPIKELPLSKELIIPIQQHIGKAGDILVAEGDHVLKGQPLTACSSPMMVPIHASTSGTIMAIKPATIAHPSGMSEPCLYLAPDGKDEWRERFGEPDFKRLSKKDIVEKVANAGISGMGGAGFPTNVKLNTIHGIKFLIINAVECEPYITADDLLIQERTSTIVDGINILDHLLSPEAILIGVEDNKPKAIAALKEHTKLNDKIKVCVLPTKYPTGGEKQLIQTLTGNEVPSGVLPVSMGIVTQNVATVFAIAEAIIEDKPLVQRVVTVTGQALSNPQNVWAPIGTPVHYLLEQCGFTPTNKQRIIMGGPLMGFTLPHTHVPIVKISNCILAPTNQEISPAEKELECIRCGQCAQVCPTSLLPQELQWYAKSQNFEQLQKLNLFDCIECGACAYVCPSQIPLVKYYRVAKAQIRFNVVQEQKAERAKLRFEARKVRLEKEKQAREAKHQQAIAARKAAAASNPSQSQASNSAVAAALARVKAKKAGQAQDTSSDTKSLAAQAIARAKAKKAAQQVTESSSNTEHDPKTRAAQAIARAKAKKLAKQNGETVIESSVNESRAIQSSVAENSDSTTQDNKPSVAAENKTDRVAQAVARAKAKKLVQQQSANSVGESTDTPINVNTKKDSVAQAVAKAKAKKLAEQKLANQDHTANDDQDIQSSGQVKTQSEVQPETSNRISGSKESPIIAQNQPSEVEAKKAKIAAAIAKAKAKKAAEPIPQSSTSDADKKKKIAAAIAKAKAKKQKENQ